MILFHQEGFVQVLLKTSKMCVKVRTALIMKDLGIAQAPVRRQVWCQEAYQAISHSHAATAYSPAANARALVPAHRQACADI